MFNLANNQKKLNENNQEISLLIKLVKIKKTGNNESCWRCGEMGTLNEWHLLKDDVAVSVTILNGSRMWLRRCPSNCGHWRGGEMDFYMCFVYFFVVWIHNKKNLSIKKRSIPFDSVIPLIETHPKERIQKKDAKYTKMFIVTSQKIPKKIESNRDV